MDFYNPVDNTPGFLRGVPGFLVTIGTDNRMPPYIGRRFAACGLLWSDKPGRHVWDAIHFIVVERIVIRILGVPEDIVVLGAPLFLGSRTVVVGPDDFVDERVASEYFIEHHLAIMNLAIIQMEEQRTIPLQYAVRFFHARAQESDEITVRIIVAVRLFVHLCSAFGMESLSDLTPSRVERRIDVNQIDRTGRNGFQELQILCKMYFKRGRLHCFLDD